MTVVESGQNPIAGQVARSLAEAYAAELAAVNLAVATALDAALLVLAIWRLRRTLVG